MSTILNKRELSYYLSKYLKEEYQRCLDDYHNGTIDKPIYFVWADYILKLEDFIHNGISAYEGRAR
jgi:hypothetical protein